MAIVQCQNGHYYDNEKFNGCPHCAALAEGGTQQDSVTVALAQEARQVENYAVEYLKRTAPQQAPAPAAVQRDMEKTVSLYEKEGVSECIAGWLVCTEGEEYGKGFPLYAGFNRIGRSRSNDIVLTDPHVSREEHCSVIYEEKRNVFYLFPKDGNLVYAGEGLVEQAQQITEGQDITIGETHLKFVPYCKGEKKWEKKK